MEEIMKVLTVIVLGAVICLFMASCEQDPRECYQKGYKQGAGDMIRKMEESADKLRSSMRDDLYPQLILMSIAAVFITLVGAEIAEQARRDICDSLKWGKQEQLTAAWTAYIIAGIATVSYSLIMFGFYDSVPVFILLGGAFISFIQVIKGIGQGNITLRKSGLGLENLWNSDSEVKYVVTPEKAIAVHFDISRLKPRNAKLCTSLCPTFGGT
jgi:hypothetical protein